MNWESGLGGCAVIVERLGTRGLLTPSSFAGLHLLSSGFAAFYATGWMPTDDHGQTS